MAFGDVVLHICDLLKVKVIHMQIDFDFIAYYRINWPIKPYFNVDGYECIFLVENILLLCCSGDDHHKKKSQNSASQIQQQLTLQQQELIQQLQIIQRQYLMHQGIGLSPLLLAQQQQQGKIFSFKSLNFCGNGGLNLCLRKSLLRTD